MERVEFTIRVFGNFVEIIPIEPISPNSIYEINLKDIKSEDGVCLLEKETVSVTTEISPA